MNPITTDILDVKNPFNRQVVGHVAYDSPQSLEEKLAKAAALVRPGQAYLPAHERREILNRLAMKMQAARQELIHTALSEGGKPYQDTAVEVDRAIQGVKEAVGAMSQLSGREIAMGLTPSSTQRLAFTRREARGLVCAISAFNHPVNLIIHQVIPAVAVGCPVLVKPASTTPLSCQTIIRFLHESGLPPEACSMVMAQSSWAEKLATDPRVAVLSFIGSAAVGWSLRSKVAAGTRCLLEHGGVAPVVVDKDADLAKVVPALVKGGYYHAGQVCISVQRVFVHQSLLGTLSEQMTAAVQKLKVGDPADPSTDLGPLITANEVKRVGAWVDEAVAKGARLLCGGQALDHQCYAPTLLLAPPQDARLSQEEIFGPVVALYPYTNIDEAIALANHPRFAFQSAVFTENLDRAMMIANRLDAAAVLINDHTAFRVDWMPFAGLKQSGLGVGGIMPSMEELTYEKLWVIKTPLA